MENEKMYIELEGYDSIEKSVRAYGRSGGLIVPKIWTGCNVKVILLECGYYNEKKDEQSKQKRRTTIPSEKRLYKLYGCNTITKNVKKQGNSGKIHIPSQWIGKYVKVILIEKPAEEEVS